MKSKRKQPRRSRAGRLPDGAVAPARPAVTPPADRQRGAGEAWWQRDPDRLALELAALTAGGYDPAQEPGAERDGVLRLGVRLPLAGGRAPAEIAYPDEYPYFRPYVTAPGLRLAHHWSPSSGEVCLLEKAGDAWSPSSTAAELLDRQWPEVLRLNGLRVHPATSGLSPPAGAGGAPAAAPGATAERPGEVPQAEPWTAYLDKQAPLVVVVPGDAVLPDGVDGGTARLQFRERDGLSRFRRAAASLGAGRGPLEPLPVALLVALLDNRGEQVWAAQAGPAPYHDGEPGTHDVGWARIREQPAAADAAGLWALAGHAAGRGSRDRRTEAVLVALPEETAQRTVGIGWAVVVRSRPHDSAAWSRPAAGQVARAGPADLRVREPSLTAMSLRRVLLVGAGGLGSAVGAELARTGPGSFTVLDADIVDPATAVRAPSAWRTAGMPKGAAMALLALDATPYTGVEAIGRRLGAPRLGPAAAEPDQFWATWDEVVAADIVVDATADFGVHLMLSDMCAASGTAYLLAEATRGVHGGTIAAVLPEAVAAGGGCWRCLSRHLTDQAIPAPPASAAPLVQGPGCDEPTYTGSGFDLAVLASHAARVAVSVLTGPDGYGTFAEPVHVASLRAPDGSPVPAAWTAHPLPSHPGCAHAARPGPAAHDPGAA